MLALVLTLLIFLVCLLIGMAIVPKDISNQDPYVPILLSPVIGLAILITGIALANRFGSPVKDLKWPFIAMMTAIIISLVFRHKDQKYDIKSFGTLLLLPVSVLFGSWPILRYGFKWLSYVNDDMNNYVLAAMRFYRNGFFEKPNTGFLSGTDYSQFYYFMHTLENVRPGSELFLSFVSIARGGNALEIFMPTILALQMMLVAGTIAMVRISLGTKKSYSISALIALTISPLVNLGFLYQLIAQVGGISIALAIFVTVSILLKSEENSKKPRNFLILGILVSAQLLWYPEIIPFIFIPILIKLLMDRSTDRKTLWVGAFSSLLLSLLLLNRYFIEALRFVLSQITSTTNSNSANKLELFPYFLKPHGLMAFFGFSPLNRTQNEPFESIGIVVALITFLTIFCFLLFQIKRMDLPTTTTAVLMLVFILLVVTQNGFGSFKIAMFAQPFLVFSLIALTAKLLERLPDKKEWRLPFKFVGITVCSVLGLLLATTSQFYVTASTGTRNQGFSEVPFGSSSKIVDKILDAEKSYRIQDGPIISTASNLSQIKLEAIASKGRPVLFLTSDVLVGYSFDSTKIEGSNISRLYANFKASNSNNKFQQLSILTNSNSKINQTYLLSNNIFESLNKTKTEKMANPWNYQLVKNPKNHLVFINSENAPIYYDPDSMQSKNTYFSPEPNPMIPGEYTQAFGNKLLLQVVNPQPNARLLIDLSSTVFPQYMRRIPKISILGQSNGEMIPIGSGSARLEIPFVKPKIINGLNYIEVNFDQILKPFPISRSGLANLYGTNVKLNPRKIAALVSNLSLINTKSENSSLIPSHVSQFPKDITNSRLLYSGAYEDGWMSKDFYFKLKFPGDSRLKFSGYVPMLETTKNFMTEMHVYLNGEKITSRKLKVGYFDLILPLDSKLQKDSINEIRFHFSDVQILPKPDGRPASVFLSYLGFENLYSKKS